MDTEMISSLLDDIIDGNNSEAKDKFDSLIATKLNSALDDRKQEISKDIFNKETEEE